jgi:hypothetical protein
MTCRSVVVSEGLVPTLHRVALANVAIAIPVPSPASGPKVRPRGSYAAETDHPLVIGRQAGQEVSGALSLSVQIFGRDGQPVGVEHQAVFL